MPEVPMNVIDAQVTVHEGDGENFIERTVPASDVSEEFAPDQRLALTVTLRPVDPDSPAVRSLLAAINGDALKMLEPNPL